MSERLPTMPEILRACASRFELSTDAIKNGAQIASVVYARRVAMFLCRVDARRSYPEIGRFFGRNHATVIDADKTILARRDGGDLALEEDLKAVRKLLAIAQGLEPTECANCARLRQELAEVKAQRDAYRVRFGCG